MSKAAVIHSFGGPEVLSIEDVEIAAPGAGRKTTGATILTF